LGESRRDRARGFRTTDDQRLPEHHLYGVIENNNAHLDHWLLREYLRTSLEARAAYAALKRENAREAQGDLAVYTARKAALVTRFLTAARAERGYPPAKYWEPLQSELGCRPVALVAREL